MLASLIRFLKAVTHRHKWLYGHYLAGHRFTRRCEGCGVIQHHSQISDCWYTTSAQERDTIWEHKYTVRTCPQDVLMATCGNIKALRAMVTQMEAADAHQEVDTITPS